MALHFDIHLHTRRHSGCSQIDEYALIPRAVRRGLDGLVITEHHYQWREAELEELRQAADAPGFVLLAGFEYSARQGDILIYGLEADAADTLEPFQDAAVILRQVLEMGALCIAAHPTRGSLGFDEDILTLPFDALEVRSVNLKPHEQRLAKRLADGLEKPGIAASDAHCLEDVGAYYLALDEAVRDMTGLRDAVKCGRFRTG
jgi:predicted metal-dependent phosphoesterase TrpH